MRANHLKAACGTVLIYRSLLENMLYEEQQENKRTDIIVNLHNFDDCTTKGTISSAW